MGKRIDLLANVSQFSPSMTVICQSSFGVKAFSGKPVQELDWPGREKGHHHPTSDISKLSRNEGFSTRSRILVSHFFRLTRLFISTKNIRTYRRFFISTFEMFEV